jgi:DNA transformation protein
MSRQSEFVDFVLEQLVSLGAVRARAMFGGHGIYHGDIFFAIIVDDRLYFKADAVTSREFAARGLSPFTYVARGKTVTLHYYEAPPEVFEDAETMRRWAQPAIGVALQAKRAKKLSGPAPP